MIKKGTKVSVEITGYVTYDHDPVEDDSIYISEHPFDKHEDYEFPLTDISVKVLKEPKLTDGFYQTCDGSSIYKVKGDTLTNVRTGWEGNSSFGSELIKLVPEK